MSIGERIARLRAAHGETLREAAERTGVSHTTIARLEKGEVTGSFFVTVAKIARGYGVSPDFLVSGRSPKQEFETQVRLLPVEERCLLLYSPQQRLKRALDFLLANYPGTCGVEAIASAAGMAADELVDMLAAWETREPGKDRCDAVAAAIVRLTGISAAWFQWGGLGGEDMGEVLARLTGDMVESAGARVEPAALAEVLAALLRSGNG